MGNLRSLSRSAGSIGCPCCIFCMHTTPVARQQQHYFQAWLDRHDKCHGLSLLTGTHTGAAINESACHAMCEEYTVKLGIALYAERLALKDAQAAFSSIH